MKKVVIIGAGVSGLSAASYLAKEGFSVHLCEKLGQTGGRARILEREGFKFDMGPTFYWMPDIFETFFAHFGKKPSDFYNLERLNPGYSVYFGKDDYLSVSASLEEIYDMFEKEEPGSSKFLQKFLEQAKYNYHIAIDKVVDKPGKSPFELVMPETVANVAEFLSSVSHNVRKNIKSDKLRQILEFPVIFLGAKPSRTPLFYRFMNYADMELGTWHIMGGFGMLSKAMENLATSLGVQIHTNMHATKINVKDGLAGSVEFTNTATGQKSTIEADFVISSADYHFSETLLEQKQRNYSEKYWQKRVFAPSALLYYVAIDKKLNGLTHHTLFFDTGFESHAHTIYDTGEWPKEPLFYGSFPSITDSSVAPQGKECAIFLIPIAPGLKESDNTREHYYNQIMDRLETLTGQSIRPYVLFWESYGVKDFVSDYHSYKGNAYGLANILTQTAFLKPSMENHKVKNLLYTGQLTVPGPGIPPSIISGRVAAKAAIKKLKKL